MKAPYRRVFKRLSRGAEEVARAFGVSPRSLYYYLDVFGRDPNEFSHIPSEVVEAFLLLKCRGISFYTLPPSSIPWPWLMVNVFNLDSLADLLDDYKERGIKTYALQVILDAGVDKWWRKPREELPVDYTEDYWEAFWRAVDEAKGLRREFGFWLEVVAPDYPDDYSSAWGKKHCLWMDSYTNVDRTLENVFHVISQDGKVRWLLPAQGYEDVPESILRSVEAYVNCGLHRSYRIALANLCVSRRASTIVETIRLAREEFEECKYHVFGPSLTAVKKAISLGYLKGGDSWDTMAWTYPRSKSFWSAKSSEERTTYFLLYLKHVVGALHFHMMAEARARELS